MLSNILEQILQIIGTYWNRWKYGHEMGHENCVKSVLIRSFFWSVLSVFELNTEIYSVNIYIQSEYGKIQTRKKLRIGHFSSSGILCYLNISCSDLFCFWLNKNAFHQKLQLQTGKVNLLSVDCFLLGVLLSFSLLLIKLCFHHCHFCY